MNLDKNWLAWLLIVGSVVIAFVTCQHQKKVEKNNGAVNGVSQGITAPNATEQGEALDISGQQNNAAQSKPIAVNSNDRQPFDRATNSLVRYQCDNNNMVQAVYNDNPDLEVVNNSTSNTAARLTINGQQFNLYRVPSQIGSLYATEQGINAGQGMKWHVQGLEAHLITMTLDHTAKPEDEQVLMRCQEPV